MIRANNRRRGLTNREEPGNWVKVTYSVTTTDSPVRLYYRGNNMVTMNVDGGGFNTFTAGLYF